MAKPKFYLEPRKSQDDKQSDEKPTSKKQAINMFYSIGAGRRLQYYTGIRIESKYFRPECNTSNTIKPVKNTAPYADQDNGRLLDMANAAVSIASNAKGEKLTVEHVREQLDLIFKPKVNLVPVIKHNVITFFEQIIEDSKSGKRLIPAGKNKGARYSHNSIKNYGISLAALKRYMLSDGISELKFEDVNKEFYDDFRHYCYTIENKEKSTFAGYIKDIKTVMSESRTPGFQTKDFIMPTYEADTIYLTLDQINKIADLDLSDKKRFFEYSKGNETVKVSYEVLDKVRDLFLIGCFTGLRFSDFSTLNSKNINGNFLNLKQIKTGDRVTIPVMSKLRPVLDKYPESIPSISNQKFNEYIKCVAKLAGLNEQVTQKNTKGNVVNETKRPLFQLISSHCCRRSYATNLFKAGIPPMLIMSATGHKTESNFLKYIRASNDDKSKLLSAALEKLGL